MGTPDLDLTSDAIALIGKGMSTSLHWFPEDASISQLASTMVGMANKDGGTILVGVSPRAGELVGLSDTPSTLDKIFQAALCAEPTLVLPIPSCGTAQKPGALKAADLIMITVPPGLPNVYSYEGRYLTREGAHSVPIPPSQLIQLLNERGAIQFESRTVPEASIDDLDTTSVLDYARKIGKIGTDDVELAYDFLVKRGCIKKVAGGYAITYAALLLFGIAPQQWLPNASILAGRFPGTGMSDMYIKQEISGNLVQQLTQVDEFIHSNLKTVVRLVGMKHVERLEYPFEAVRELMVNAVAHRDYNLQGDNTHLNIFSDRLVVSSPGTLPGPVTLQNLLVARFARNPVITQVLSDLGFVERLGYGLDRVVQVTEKEGLPSPRFEEVAKTFQVTLFSPVMNEAAQQGLPELSAYWHMDLNPRQQQVISLLALRQRITNHEAQALNPGVHAETIRRDLADLVSRGILIKVGDRKATYYILKKV